MKPTRITFVLALLASSALHAQDGPPRGHRPPPSPVVIALDTDKDRTISAEEITAAPTSLLTLDADGDGALTPDELHPPRPEGAGGPRDGKGPRGGRPPGPPEE